MTTSFYISCRYLVSEVPLFQWRLPSIHDVNIYNLTPTLLFGCLTLVSESSDLSPVKQNNKDSKYRKREHAS